MNKSTLKTYALSSLITFLTMFSLTLVAGIDTGITLGQEAGLSLIVTALRAGVKAAIEYISMKITEKYVK